MKEYKILFQKSLYPHNIDFPKYIKRSFEGSLILKPNTYSPTLNEEEKIYIEQYVKKVLPNANLYIIEVKKPKDKVQTTNKKLDMPVIKQKKIANKKPKSGLAKIKKGSKK